MRRIFLFMNVSLDGYFEDESRDISGFHADFEAFKSGESNKVDTLLLGHRTYEMMKFWSTPEGAALQPDVARFMNERQKVVASHAPFEPGWQNVTVFSGDVLEQVRALKAEPGQDILIMGSNSLCVSLMSAGLIDEFQIVVNPVVFGAGTSLFEGLSQQAELTLVDTTRFQSGAILLRYVPAAA